jgi:NADH-quinone oxidoreductase subunit J
MAAIISSIVMLVWFAASSDPWRLLIAYSSISTRLLIGVIFIEMVTGVDFISSVALLFLILNTSGTIIAAYYLGVRR